MTMNWPTTDTELSVKPTVILDLLKQYAMTDPGNPEAQQVVTLCNSLSGDQAVEPPTYNTAATFVYGAMDEPPDWAKCATLLQSAEEELNPPPSPPGG